MSDIFISYSRKDSDFAKRLNQELNNKSKDVWIDFEDIPRGIDFLDEIYDGIEKADSLCVLVSRSSLMSEICQLELAHAIKHHKRILPLILEKIEGDVLKIVKGHWADMAWAELARKNWDVLSHLNWLIFDDDSRFEAEFAALILAAEQDIVHLKTHTRLLVRAIEWQKAEKNPSFLLFGDEIDAAEAWLKKWDELPAEKRPNPPPDSLHRDYSDASRQAEQNRQAELAQYQTLIQQEQTKLQQTQNKLKSEQRAGMITAGFGGLVIGVSVMMAYFLFQFLGAARNQAAELQAQANTVGTEVANANSQLTAIPPTLTQVASDVQEAQNTIDTLLLASQSLASFDSGDLRQLIENRYLLVNGPIRITSASNNLEDIEFSCQIYSEEAGYEIHLRESASGVLILTFSAGDLTISQLGPTNELINEFQVRNFYIRAAWQELRISFLGNQLQIYLDNELRFEQTLTHTLDAGTISFVANSSDTFRLDKNCILTVASFIN